MKYNTNDWCLSNLIVESVILKIKLAKMTTVRGRVRMQEDQVTSYFLLITFLDNSFTELELNPYLFDSDTDIYILYFESNVSHWLQSNFKLKQFRKMFLQQKARWLRDGRVYY